MMWIGLCEAKPYTHHMACKRFYSNVIQKHLRIKFGKDKMQRNKISRVSETSQKRNGIGASRSIVQTKDLVRCVIASEKFSFVAQLRERCACRACEQG